MIKAKSCFWIFWDSFITIQIWWNLRKSHLYKAIGLKNRRTRQNVLQPWCGGQRRYLRVSQKHGEVILGIIGPCQVYSFVHYFSERSASFLLFSTPGQGSSQWCINLFNIPHYFPSLTDGILGNIESRGWRWKMNSI